MMFYTQGYAHAKDRLWAMERLRRFANATLSEMLGDETLPIDKLSLTFGIGKAARETWDKDGVIPDLHKKYMQAYADGVNDFIFGESTFLAPEFYVFGFNKKNMAPWHPIDSFGIMRTMGLFLSYSWCHDLLRDIIGNLENENGV